MKTINNTEPMPMIPQGCKGEWKWNGFEITSTSRDSVNGELFQRKGKWMWLPQVDDSKNAWMANASISEINSHYKGEADTLTISNVIVLTLALIIGGSIVSLIIL